MTENTVDPVEALVEIPAQLRSSPSYVRFVASRMLSSMGYQGTAIALGWLVYDQTHSAYALGLIGLLQFIPLVVLTFVVGHVADRFDRRRIGLVCQVIEAFVIVALGLAVLFNVASVPLIFTAIVLIGSAQAFERPTLSALLPNIVPASILPRAIATSTSLQQVAGIIGPSVGGLLYGLGAPVPFLVAGVMFAIGSVCVATIPYARDTANRGPSTLRSVFAGIGFIRSQPIVLGVISLDLFAVLFGGVVALLPIFARDILHAGPWGLGLLRAAPAAGAIAMSVYLVRFPLERDVGMKMLISVAAFGAAAAVFSLSSNLWLSLAALVVLGASDTVSIVIRLSLVQLLTPDDMRGRVSAVNSLFVGTSNQLGEFESGIAAGLLGPVTAGVLGGLATVGIVLLWSRIFPGLRRVRTLSG